MGGKLRSADTRAAVNDGSFLVVGRLLNDDGVSGVDGKVYVGVWENVCVENERLLGIEFRVEARVFDGKLDLIRGSGDPVCCVARLGLDVRVDSAGQ